MNDITQEINIDKCMACNSRIIDNGQHLVCINCGLILRDTNIVTNTYGRFQKYNCSVPLGTCIDKPMKSRFVDIKGKMLTPKAKNLYGRLRNLDKILYYQDYNGFHKYYTIANMIASHLKINKSTLYEIMHLFRKLLSNKKDCIKHNRITLLATCFHTIFKQNKIPITALQLMETFNKYGHRVNGRLIFQNVLNLNISKTNAHPKDYIEIYLDKVSKIKDFEKRLIRKLPIIDLDTYMSLLRKTVYNIIKSKIIDDKFRQPDCLAATVIYFASILIDKKFNGKKTITQKMMDDAIGINEQTIRLIYKKLFEPYVIKRYYK
ncbi:MAG: hypothetical protein ACFFG0_34240 [Candidatus Thorarchaeota archaeon]